MFFRPLSFLQNDNNYFKFDSFIRTNHQESVYNPSNLNQAIIKKCKKLKHRTVQFLDCSIRTNGYIYKYNILNINIEFLFSGYIIIYLFMS